MSRLATTAIWAEHNGYEIVNSYCMRRSLVLTNEAARHPFRANLPSHVFDLIEEHGPEFEPEVKAALAKAKSADEPVLVSSNADCEQSWWQLTRSDVRGFASTYLATFLAVLVFIM